jgi:hypothetical protein
MYLAFQDVHEGCARPDKLGVQAPLSSVELYNTTVLDTYKIHGAMLTELDYGVEEVVAALKGASLWDNTLLVFYSDKCVCARVCAREPPPFPPKTHKCATNFTNTQQWRAPRPLHELPAARRQAHVLRRRAARGGVPFGRAAARGGARNHVVRHGSR